MAAAFHGAAAQAERSTTVYAVDRVLAALRDWSELHEQGPPVRVLAEMAGLPTPRCAVTAISKARKGGFIAGRGRSLRITEDGLLRALARGAQPSPPSGASLAVRGADALAESRRIRRAIRADLEARLELHARLRDEHDAEVARLDEALRHLEEDEP